MVFLSRDEAIEFLRREIDGPRLRQLTRFGFGYPGGASADESVLEALAADIGAGRVGIVSGGSGGYVPHKVVPTQSDPAELLASEPLVEEVIGTADMEVAWQPLLVDFDLEIDHELPEELKETR